MPDDDEFFVHTDSSEIEPQVKPPRDDGKCQYCGGETDQAYGMAGGGIGVYSYCTACSRIIDKCQDPEMELDGPRD